MTKSEVSRLAKRFAINTDEEFKIISVKSFKGLIGRSVIGIFDKEFERKDGATVYKYVTNEDIIIHVPFLGSETYMNFPSDYPDKYQIPIDGSPWIVPERVAETPLVEARDALVPILEALASVYGKKALVQRCIDVCKDVM